MVGPSHRTDRPALASQDEISSQEGRNRTGTALLVSMRERTGGKIARSKIRKL
jgi:hypothetical protein